MIFSWLQKRTARDRISALSVLCAGSCVHTAFCFVLHIKGDCNDMEKIAIACDHCAFELKNVLIEHMRGRGKQVYDLGCHSSGDAVDYPVFAERVAMAVSSGEADGGILICGTGIGMSIAAGKVRGIRCVCCSDEYSIKMSRSHNDANILCMGARVPGVAEKAAALLDVWLDTEFDGERHARRVAMYEEIEKRQIK